MKNINVKLVLGLRNIVLNPRELRISENERFKKLKTTLSIPNENNTQIINDIITLDCIVINTSDTFYKVDIGKNHAELFDLTRQIMEYKIDILKLY